jgi:VWFA-related protein
LLLGEQRVRIENRSRGPLLSALFVGKMQLGRSLFDGTAPRIAAALLLGLPLLFADGGGSDSLSGHGIAWPVRPGQAAQEKAVAGHEVAVTLKLVQVYVADKKGRPVLGLKKGDFVIRDNGKAQRVTDFESHVMSIPALGKEAAPDNIAPTPLEPPRSLMPRKFFLFFDFAYNNPRGLRKAKEAALHFIDTQLIPSDEVGVLSFSGMQRLQLWDYLTADHARVREVVEAFGMKSISGRVDNLQQKYYEAITAQNPLDAGAWGKATLKGNEKSLPDMGSKPDWDKKPDLVHWKFSEKGELHALMFADRVKDLALALRYIPGQKSIVLLSSGVPYSLIYGVQAPYGDGRVGDFGESLLRQRYDDMLRELSASNCVIYALDTEEPGAAIKTDLRAMGIFTLQEITSATGGKYFGNINKYAEHIEKIQNMTGCYYVLGYYIDEEWDGAFHEIEVEVARPGCKVHAQKGYHNPKLFREYNELERMLHLVDLALTEEPVLQRSVRFSLTASPGPPDGKANLLLSAELPLEKISAVLEGKYEIVGIIFDRAGNAVALKREERTSAGKSPLNADYRLDFRVAPGSYECRLIIRNLETGGSAVGGTSISLER